MNAFKLRRPLRDLGGVDSRLTGILSPGYSQREVDQHIHALFQEDYREYMRPFPLSRAGIDHWKGLIHDALPPRYRDYRGRMAVLDIGSGEGTSVFPMIELFPDADIIASDLSTNLLIELREWHDRHYPDHRHLWLLQLNAEDTVFEDGQIDLLTGAHVLHHLANLSGTFKEIDRILKPSGCAIFWDGFEDGLQILSLVMQILIAMNETARERLTPEVLQTFQLFMADLHRRKGSWKPPELLSEIDDKWIFTRTQLERSLAGTELQLKEIRQIYSPDGLIALMLDHELRRRLQQLDALPQWARRRVHEIDQQFSDELKREKLFGGTIIITKRDR